MGATYTEHDSSRDGGGRKHQLWGESMKMALDRYVLRKEPNDEWLCCVIWMDTWREKEEGPTKNNVEVYGGG